MVAYNVTKDIHTPIPDPNNVKDLDDIAKDIYFTAIEVPACAVYLSLVSQTLTMLTRLSTGRVCYG